MRDEEVHDPHNCLLTVKTLRDYLLENPNISDDTLVVFADTKDGDVTTFCTTVAIAMVTLAGATNDKGQVLRDIPALALLSADELLAVEKRQNNRTIPLTTRTIQ